jgi:DNA-binding beta-propeller fold protein YncE
LYGNTAVGFGGTVADQLYQINPATGLSTLIGPIGFSAVYALGFNQSGTLYGISDTSHELITINTGTGVGSLIAPVNLSSAFDLAFRPEDDTLFVADSNTSSLYTINPGTGAETLVGSYGSAVNNVGLAFVAAVPEPGTIGLLLAGVALLGWKARKRTGGSQLG